MTVQSGAAKTRIRRLPDEAQREILDAAEEALAERPFRDLSVDDLMRRTGMRRSSFYHYFRSLEDVAIALLKRVQDEMMEVAIPWMQDDEDPERSLHRGIYEVAVVYARHGPVLAAIHEASFHHESVQRAWREGVQEDWIRAISARLRDQRERGLTRVEDPDEIARALLLMNTAVFVERLGAEQKASPKAVAETLAWVWAGALYR